MYLLCHTIVLSPIPAPRHEAIVSGRQLVVKYLPSLLLDDGYCLHSLIVVSCLLSCTL